jgi:hypothetical protein
MIYRIPNGTLVAAKVSESKDEWILSTIIQYFPGQFKYEVEDVEEEGSTKE